MKIPLANPARELERIKDFEPRFNKKLKEGQPLDWKHFK